MRDDAELRPSEEADQRQIDLAREAGEMHGEAANYVIEEVADAGGREREGDYAVGFAQEEAEGTYRMRDGELALADPAEDDNCHLEVIVTSVTDGRFGPHLTVTATLEGERETVGPEEIPFVWHPGLYHYGKNLALPGDGTYDITVEVEPARFPRHDETNGDRFAEGVVVTFEDVDVTTGRG